MVNALLQREPGIRLSVSYTTRPPRPGEQDGVDYHFVTPARFEEMVRQGAFAEWAEVHGSRYGTLRATVEEALAQRRVVVFDIDVQGGAAIRALWPEETVTVFVLPPIAISKAKTSSIASAVTTWRGVRPFSTNAMICTAACLAGGGVVSTGIEASEGSISPKPVSSVPKFTRIPSSISGGGGTVKLNNTRTNSTAT